MERQRLKLAMKSLQWGGEEIVPNSKMTTHVWRCYGSKALHFLKKYKYICLVIWHYFAGISVPHMDPGTHWMRNILKSLKEILKKKIQLKSCWGQVGVRWVTGGREGRRLVVGLEAGTKNHPIHLTLSIHLIFWAALELWEFCPPKFTYSIHFMGSFRVLGVGSTKLFLSTSYFRQFSRWIVWQLHPLCQSFSLSTRSNFINFEQNPNF